MNKNDIRLLTCNNLYSALRCLSYMITWLKDLMPVMCDGRCLTGCLETHDCDAKCVTKKKEKQLLFIVIPFDDSFISLTCKQAILYKKNWRKQLHRKKLNCIVKLAAITKLYLAGCADKKPSLIYRDDRQYSSSQKLQFLDQKIKTLTQSEKLKHCSQS